MDHVQKMTEWAKEHPGLVWGWAATTWEGPPDLRDHQTSMHMTPLAPAWRVLELEDEIAALRTEIERLQKYAERYRWLRDSATVAQLQMFEIRRGTSLAADRVCDVGIEAAMLRTPNAWLSGLGAAHDDY